MVSATPVRNYLTDPVMHFTPLYEAGRIQDIIAEFEQLIETVREEEPVQKYLEEHPVLWAFCRQQKSCTSPLC